MDTRIKIAPAEKKEKTITSDRVVTAVVYTLLVIWAIVVIFPFYWMLMTSMTSKLEYDTEITATSLLPRLFVQRPVFDNFVRVFTEFPILTYFSNTLIFTLLTTALTLVTIIPASYAFSRLNFKGKTLVFTLILSLMMIPTELVVITNYATVVNLGLRDNYLGLILPSVTSVFYIYLLKENFSQIPDQLYHAAKVDGTSDFKYMWKVMLPICKPTVITITVLKVIECWNSYIWPRLVTTEESFRVISLGIEVIKTEAGGREDMIGMMAGVVIVTLPLIILFCVFRRKIMEGVARGGTKG